MEVLALNYGQSLKVASSPGKTLAAFNILLDYVQLLRELKLARTLKPRLKDLLVTISN